MSFVGISTSMKNTSLHIFRDPLLDLIDNDSDIDLLGVVVVGTSEHNEWKTFLATRLGKWIESLRPDGVIITLDMAGNQHIDFTNAIAEFVKSDIPTVGLTIMGADGLVITNPYLDKATIIDYKKTTGYIETEVVGDNHMDEVDVKKALAFLKLKMRKDAK
ncbi:glycine/sarcosine/betaine reductase component B subunit [Clostridioides difficile]|nr:glycine/sarcosine/betaine reductase component B subunit [Clostridioides difficile]EQE18065.1 glycine/sarcosine/betaine reductase component B subunits family protein [Clostridioides difficile CD18]EGT3705670.1 proline reductase [Clostridioides difficile]EGT3796380.1 proline reductase [Clostridioides difficile]EGT3811863.1 proline reductase [Clostridioides difficile]EGT3855031.1 proline reductase [Clostridioides difficile]